MKGKIFLKKTEVKFSISSECSLNYNKKSFIFAFISLVTDLSDMNCAWGKKPSGWKSFLAILSLLQLFAFVPI